MIPKCSCGHDQTAHVYRARIAHAIALAEEKAFVLARQVVAREQRPTLVLGELVTDCRREREKIEDWLEKNTSYLDGVPVHGKERKGRR